MEEEVNEIISSPLQYQNPSKNSIIKTLKPNTNLQPNINIHNSQKQKKKISYDDLLSNMGMTLVNGKLELYNISKIQSTNSAYQQQPKKQQYRNVADYKYHQNQQQPQQPQQQQITKQQYKKMIAIEYIKNQQERNRINQIKSKKLLFSNPDTIYKIQTTHNINRFFSFATTR